MNAVHLLSWFCNNFHFGLNHSGVLQRNIAPEECNTHMYALWPRCNRESWSEAPDRASSWGWDGWLLPTADPLPSVDQLQPHDSQSAPAAQELLNFHNLLRGPDTMHAACRLCYDVKKTCCIIHRIRHVLGLRRTKGLARESLRGWYGGQVSICIVVTRMTCENAWD